MDLRVVAPATRWPPAAQLEQAQALARAHGGSVRLTQYEADGVAGADLVIDRRGAADGADDAMRYAFQALLLSTVG